MPPRADLQCLPLTAGLVLTVLASLLPSRHATSPIVWRPSGAAVAGTKCRRDRLLPKPFHKHEPTTEDYRSHVPDIRHNGSTTKREPDGFKTAITCCWPLACWLPRVKADLGGSINSGRLLSSSYDCWTTTTASRTQQKHGSARIIPGHMASY
ncbi:hypothetical protein GQ602_004691 [Ophiocordyceps camponoti-floridani]|uniref:Secreted protein n=1 Tax=Ophiocordyceps camponoti-floridani TaxID=2030778 RepID=A0A8H4Q486_9HYPO|nr:hypothetical protein GQ602_004691 [Ophiocordyceps camponoti-floridani]